MAKRIMILIYILVVLAISGFSRADSRVPASVFKASLNNQTSIMTLQALASMNCYARPRLEVMSINNNSHVVVLNLYTSGKAVICSDVLAQELELSYDLRQVNLEPGIAYSLVFKNISVAFLSLPYTPNPSVINSAGGSFAQATIDGVLTYVRDSASFVVTSGSRTISVSETAIDLSRFIDRRVTVSGIFIDATAPLTGIVVPLSVSSEL